MIEKLQCKKLNDTVTKKTLGFRVLIEEQIIPKIIRYEIQNITNFETLFSYFLYFLGLHFRSVHVFEEVLRKVFIEYSTVKKGRLFRPTEAPNLYKQLVGIKEEGDRSPSSKSHLAIFKMKFA